MNKGLSRRLSMFQRLEASPLLLAGCGEGERRGGIEGSGKLIFLASHGGEGEIALIVLLLPQLR
jgi:hypothetical protein